MDVADFDECVKNALSIDYRADEIELVLSLIHEHVSPTVPLRLLDIVDAVAVRRGLPCAKFLYDLKGSPPYGQSASGSAYAVKSKSNYHISLSPAFYVQLLGQVSTLSEDFDLNCLFTRITQRWACADDVPFSPHWTSVQSQLNRVRNTTIAIAKKILANKAFEKSLRCLEKDTAPHFYEERRLPAKWVESFHRPRANWKLITLEEEKQFSSNCFRCSAIVSLDAQHDSPQLAQENSTVEHNLQQINIERLRYRDEEEAVRHYLTEHLYKTEQWRTVIEKKEPIPTSCVSLVPCVLCIRAYLVSGREEIVPEDNLFYCCEQDHSYHLSSFHSDLPLTRVSGAFLEKFAWNPQIVEETRNLFDILCLACLEVFGSRIERRNHQRHCFLRFATLSNSFGEPITVDFSSSPYSQAHFQDKLKKATTNQLKIFRDSLARRSEGYNGWPTQPAATQEELRLKIEGILMAEEDNNQSAAHHRQHRQQAGNRSREPYRQPLQQQQQTHSHQPRPVVRAPRQQQHRPQLSQQRQQHQQAPRPPAQLRYNRPLLPLPPNRATRAPLRPPFRAPFRAPLPLPPPPPLLIPPPPIAPISPPSPADSQQSCSRGSRTDLRLPFSVRVPPPLLPSADPSRGPAASFSPMNCYRSSSAMTPPAPTPAGAATNFNQPPSDSLIRSMLQQPVSSVVQPFLPFIKRESVWQRSSHLQSVTFSIDDHRLLSDDETLTAEQGSLHKGKFP